MVKNTASARPRTSAGTAAGTRLAVSSGPRARSFNRAMPNANGSPRPTDTTAVTSASQSVLVSAVVNRGFAKASPYQSSVRPSMGRLSRGDVVNENSTVTTTGAKR